MKKKLLIFIITYEAGHRVLEVFKKIPFKNLKKYNVSILISDDCSKDSTVNFAKKIKYKKIYINKNHKNLGYGGNIKFCIKYALKKNIDYAVMIHGDCQYNPKFISKMIKTFDNDEKCYAVNGSRLFYGIKSAIKGGMPFYKLIGNVVLTKIFNYLIKTNFTDVHSGLWAYRIKGFKNKKFTKLTNSFNFDQEMRFLYLNNNKIIKEIPITTRYADERSQLHVIYAIRFLISTLLFCLKRK